MAKLQVKDASKCEFDEISLGEVMLRLDPGERRIHTARSFSAWEGGGEYNVARGLRRCFGHRTAIVTGLADNPIGHLLEDLMLQGGVDVSNIVWRKADGAGRQTRNGINFTERGYGPRAALGCSDRGHTAVSQLKAGEVDWKALFARGSRWFHTGGIFAALSESTSEVALEACRTAREAGTCVSYDLNYRPSLWGDIGGEKKAQEVNSEVVKHVDVLFGNEEDFQACLGFELEGVDETFNELPIDSFKRMIEKVLERYPHLTTVGTTLRSAHTASVNGWGAVAYHEGKFYEVAQQDFAIRDRVGGGDSFASGVIHGLLEGEGGDWALRCGVAHGALAMSTPGDTTMARLKEVKALMDGKGARIAR